MMGGVGQMRVPTAFLETLSLPVPSHAEQLRILDALDELLSDLDAGVKALESVRAKLRQYRAAVLKAAVDGTLTAEWRKANPDVEPASELLKRILAERRRRWEEGQLKKYRDAGKEPPKNWRAKYEEPPTPDTTNLVPMPPGWSWASIEQLGDVGTGATPNRSKKARYYTGGTVPWVTSNCVNAPFVREPTEFVTLSALDECNLSLYPVGTLLLAMYGEGKTRGKCTELLIATTTNQALAAIQTDQRVKGYLKIFLARNYDHTRRGASGGVQPNLNLSIVREIVLPLPPGEEQEMIVEAVEDQLSVIDHLESDLGSKLKGAQALRQSILKAAFEGKLVPQEPNDEPASELLKRIAAERAERERLAKQAKKPAKTAKFRGSTRGQDVSAVSAE
jgi:type I restriction enzyme S subunit